MTNPKAIKEKLYQIVDSFLVEAVDQEGNVRCLDKLNGDRHLAVSLFEALISDLLETQKVELLSKIKGIGAIEEIDSVTIAKIINRLTLEI